MDIQKFENPDYAVAESSSTSLRSRWQSAKQWLYPPTAEKRSKRLEQYRDITLFLTAVSLVAIFEPNLRRNLEVNSQTVSKMISEMGAMGGDGMGKMMGDM